jgi:hypothetical protein
MKQSRFMSLVESCGNTATGFVMALVAQAIFWPMLGVHISHGQNLISVGIMTVLSVVRSLAWRRLMEAFHVRRPLSPAMRAIIAERIRQIEVEGWDAAHDDREHLPGEIAMAGGCYAISHTGLSGEKCSQPSLWPWSAGWWKPQDFRRDLVRAGALILAEIEKFDRNRRVKR